MWIDVWIDVCIDMVHRHVALSPRALSEAAVVKGEEQTNADDEFERMMANAYPNVNPEVAALGRFLCRCGSESEHLHAHMRACTRACAHARTCT